MNRFGGDVSAVPPRDLKRPMISNSTTGQILPHVASAPTANVIRMPMPCEMSRAAANNGWKRRRGVSREGIYTDSALFHFSGEKIACLFMPRNSPTAGRLYIAASAKTANGFASRPNPADPFPSPLANALTLTPGPHRRVGITYA